MYGLGNGVIRTMKTGLVKYSGHAHTHTPTQARTLTNHISIYFRKQALHGLPSVCGILGLCQEQLQLHPKDVRKSSQCKRHAVLQPAFRNR